jgi:hypothetical protein
MPEEYQELLSELCNLDCDLCKLGLSGSSTQTRVSMLRESLASIIERDEMKKTYAYHKPSEVGLDKLATLRQAFSNLHDLLEKITPECYEQSVALTNLETTAMWAIKAVVCNDPESVVSI